MEENFCIAAFRSRQQVMAFEKVLRMSGISSSIVTTPRAVAIGCGLSVRFEEKDMSRVRQLYQQHQPGNLIGFYSVEQAGPGRATVRAVPRQPRI
ncbi:MAG: DUF3343 domain-containing protein [Clostridia bacterium]|nr:DUF3343 domain-containing protein [Clostridia bacterium]